ncbi:MAG: hypothetical protein P4M15_00005 [Alphaproteobacteria bacterium]|nr:hypothetical protein [Alphaproteobacteria bacterium]
MKIRDRYIEPADIAAMSVEDGLECLNGIAQRVAAIKPYHRLGVILLDLVYNAGEAAKSGILNPHAKQDLHDCAVEIATSVKAYSLSTNNTMGRVVGFIVDSTQHMLGAHTSPDKAPVDFVEKGRTLPLRALLPSISQPE